jgi:hypothetical protein
MTDRAPVELTNLDRYGVPPLPWSRPRDLASNPAGTVSARRRCESGARCSKMH